VVLTDPRWFSTLPDPDKGGPLLELRRWPGDTAFAVYAVAGPLSSQGESGPPVPDGVLAPKGGGPSGWEQWVGTVETEAGERPAVWLERRIGDAPARMGVLVLPGDAGLGADAIDDLRAEGLALLPRIEVRPEAWRVRSGIPQGETIALPRTADVPGDKNESEAPWQVARGRDFTVGLPPGFRARRMDGGVPPPREIPGGRLWFRGRFVDEQSTEVVVGDEEWFGYVAEVRPADDAWWAGEAKPLAAVGAERVSAEPFDLAADRAGAKQARAEHWHDAAFGGEWLVFRLKFESHGVEIGIPVESGRRSPSLFWIPVTWRPAGSAPAPPPVDPAERFGIRFERLRRTDEQRHPWTEGYLRVPGLRADVPKGWFPAASLRSSDGFPVRLLERRGAGVGTLTRLEADELPPVGDSTVWTEAPRRGRHRADAVYRRADGACLLVAPEGHAFLFEPGVTEGKDWSELWERLLGSAQLLGPG
jgi:hypothetical protein